MKRRLGRLHRDERGAGLIEALVASALLGVALVVLMGSLSTLAIASREAESEALAGAFARAQAARIKAAPYQAAGDYSASYEPLPGGVTRSVGVAWWDGVSGWSGTANGNGLQRIVLTLDAGGAAVTLEFVKADR